MQTIKIKEFAGRLRDSVSHNPETRVVFFLGAGCSIRSGIPSAGGLVRNWLDRIRKAKGLDDSDWSDYLNETFPEAQVNPAQYYEKAYQTLFLTAQQGQQEIERLMDEGSPGFGYISLAQLMTHPDHGRQMNVVLTTNFDDLPAEALYLYTSARPRVIAHESLATYSRASVQRPLIVKLHGDAHLDPQSAGQGIRELNSDMRNALARLLRDATLVFLGYGGNDESVAQALREHQGQICEGGVFWLSKDTPGQAIAPWLEEVKAVQVDHRDFDEALFYLRDVFDLEHPNIEERATIQQQTYMSTHERLRDAVSQEAQQRPNAQTSELMSLLAKSDDSLDWWAWQERINKVAKSDPVRAEQLYREAITELPGSHELVGNFANFVADRLEDNEEAERLYRRALDIDPLDATHLGNFANFMWNARKNLDEADGLYRKAIKIDPVHANNLGNFATFMWKAHKDVGEAERLYRRALEIDPGDASILGNFANLLLDERKDGREAERLYRLALEIDPDDAVILGNLANFLKVFRKEFDEAERLYLRSLDIDPDDANVLGNYANLLIDERKDDQEAERLYHRALEIDPNHANHLANFARFMFERRKDYDEAERLYQRAIEIDPGNANVLGNFAGFLTHVRKDHDAVEQMFRQALEIEPDHVNHLGNLAAFLTDVRKDHGGAERLYRRVIELDPDHVSNLSNFSEFLLTQGRFEEGFEYLSRAEALVNADSEKLVLVFYRYAHGPDDDHRRTGLETCHYLLEAGVRSPFWNLDPIRVSAEKEGHEELDLLTALASVITDKQDLESLNEFETWRALSSNSK